MGVSLGYGDPGQTSQQFPGSDKVDDLVGAEPPAPLLGGALAPAFHQDLMNLPHQAGMGLPGKFILQGLQACQALRLDVFRHLIGKSRRPRLGARGIFKGEGLVESSLPHEVKGLEEVSLRFPGKAHDQIGGQGDAGAGAP